MSDYSLVWELFKDEVIFEEVKVIFVDDLEEWMLLKVVIVYEFLCCEGECELLCEVFVLFWLVLVGGIIMSLLLVVCGIIRVNLFDIELGFLIEVVGYIFGFIFVIVVG